MAQRSGAGNRSGDAVRGAERKIGAGTRSGTRNVNRSGDAERGAERGLGAGISWELTLEISKLSPLGHTWDLCGLQASVL